jgi:hypothetical protein
MKAKFGALVVDGRGKINGFVASKNRAGAYFRTKVTPVNPQTADQSAVRSLFTSLAQGWRALTADQIAGWNGAVQNFSKTDIFGDLKNPSGFNLYMRLNSNQLNVGAALLTDAPQPADTTLLDAVTVVADASASTMTLNYALGAGASGAVVVEATAPVSNGKSFVKNLYRKVAVNPDVTVTPFEFGADYEAKFGNLVAGQKIYVRVKTVNTATGQTGTPQAIEVIVGA